MSLRASETSVAIATPWDIYEIPEQVRDDEYSYANKIKHVIVPLALRDDVNNAITTSNAAHSPRNDKNITPRPLGRGIKGEGLSHEMLKQVQHDKLVSEAHVNELNVLSF